MILLPFSSIFLPLFYYHLSKNTIPFILSQSPYSLQTKEQAPISNDIEACKKLRNKWTFFNCVCDCPFGIVRGCSPRGALSIAHLPGHENIPYDYPHFLVWNQTVKQPHRQDARMLSIRYWNYLFLLFSALSFICARMAVRYAFRHAFFPPVSFAWTNSWINPVSIASFRCQNGVHSVPSIG